MVKAYNVSHWSDPYKMFNEKEGLTKWFIGM